MKSCADAWTGRIAIFGDLSGHTVPLYPALDELGVNLSTETIPEDLVIVQVGDLVHKGPDGDEAVALVDRLMGSNPPGRWLQLIGNHEANHLGGPAFGICDCSAATVSTLGRWLEEGALHLGVAIEAERIGPTLVTHAGLTRQVWAEIGQPANPVDAAGRLDQMLQVDRRRAFAAGAMLHGFETDQAGVVWADAATELYRSWVDLSTPFAQVHGHSSAWWWDRPAWRRGIPAAVARQAVLHKAARHLEVSIGGHSFVGIDPGYGPSAPGSPMTPLALSGRVLWPDQFDP